MGSCAIGRPIMMLEEQAAPGCFLHYNASNGNNRWQERKRKERGEWTDRGESQERTGAGGIMPSTFEARRIMTSLLTSPFWGRESVWESYQGMERQLSLMPRSSPPSSASAPTLTLHVLSSGAPISDIQSVSVSRSHSAVTLCDDRRRRRGCKAAGDMQCTTAARFARISLLRLARREKRVEERRKGIGAE